MAINSISLGDNVTGENGDTLREAFIKSNENFSFLQTEINQLSQTQVSSPQNSTSGNIATFNTNTSLSDSGFSPNDFVVQAGVVDDKELVVFDGTSGRLIQSSGISYENIALKSGNSTAFNLAGFASSDGKTLVDINISSSDVYSAVEKTQFMILNTSDDIILETGLRVNGLFQVENGIVFTSGSSRYLVIVDSFGQLNVVPALDYIESSDDVINSSDDFILNI